MYRHTGFYLKNIILDVSITSANLTYSFSAIK